MKKLYEIIIMTLRHDRRYKLDWDEIKAWLKEREFEVIRIQRVRRW